jgi:signal transduction histidine kinase
MPAEEHRWLSDLNVDLFVPICTKEKWTGLFALGPKPGAAQFNEQDLSLLSTLADQTVVALENARLVADLETANRNRAEAYKALEKANQELRELDELKSSFIGVITHEMRTPFANIGFSIQIIERLGLDHLTPDQKEQFNQLKSGVDLASGLVNNLVTLAEFLNNQVKLRLERLTFRDVLRETIVPLKKMADEKRLEFKVDLMGEMLPLSADRKLLTTAVYHLVHNAIKFTKPGGKVWVSCWTTAEAIYFDVKDTGVGIPAEKLSSMWSEFGQMADSFKRGAEGLGLGLALVKFVIAAHGGEIWAESKEGEGSVFGFQIPLTIKPPKRPTDVFRKRPQYQRM